MTIEDYRDFHDQHCPAFSDFGLCECWIPEVDDEDHPVSQD